MDRIKEKLRKFWYWLNTPIRKIKNEIKYRKRIKEMKKRDPFIYK